MNRIHLARIGLVLILLAGPGGVSPAASARGPENPTRDQSPSFAALDSQRKGLHRLLDQGSDAPGLAPLGRGPGLVPAAPGDTFFVFQHSFDDPLGSCNPMGWQTEDRTSRIFAHVSSRFLAHIEDVNMETRALWVGADSTTALDETRNWVYPYGYGNNWSQRIVSPRFSIAAHPNAVLYFAATLDFDASGTIVPGLAGEFLAVQARLGDGTWVFLNVRYDPVPLGTSVLTAGPIRGQGVFLAEAHLGADGNQSLAFADTTQLRIVVQTSQFISQEDGREPPTRGAAVLDNLNVLDGGLPVVPRVDFEDGTTGSWTLSALNGVVATIPPTSVTRDVPLPATSIALRDQFDVADPTCVWTFLSPGDTVASGIYAQLVSPWFPVHGDSSRFVLGFAARLNAFTQSRFLRINMRGKKAGETRPSVAGRPPFIYFGGAGPNDIDIPFEPFFEAITYPDNFFINLPDTKIDSAQVIIQIEDRGERFSGLEGRPTTRLPVVDDLGVYQLGQDPDGDGVPDPLDLCPGVSAAGQDADGDGCVDATATLRHVEYWSVDDRPIRFTMTETGDPRITDGSDHQAIRDAFASWEAVDGTDVEVIEEPLTTRTDAAALDGINLLAFQDDFSFPANVIAITPTTSFTRRVGFGDRMVLPGQIVDADVIFNPQSRFSTPSAPLAGSFDLESVVAHEAGHLFGISHSGVLDATMFPVLLTGDQAASLEDDDRAAIAAAFPAASLATNYGSIAGRVTRGGTGAPVPGALVIAALLDGGGTPIDSTASDYTREDGSYALYRLPPGPYGVRIQPLDGSLPGVVPEAINQRVLDIAETDFPAEWYSVPENESDDPNARAPIFVDAGTATVEVDLVTNIDVTPPEVTSVSPPGDSTDIRIDTPILVGFSEPIQDSTLATAFRLHVEGNPNRLGGRGQVLPPGASFVFTPDQPLEFGTDYVIEVTTALTDRSGVPMAAPFESRFRTETRPTIAITDIQPRSTVAGALVAISGVGFNPAPGAVNLVLFTVSEGTQDSIPGTQVTPTSMVVRVPGNAATGPVVVVGAGPEVSNEFGITVLEQEARTAPAPSGDAIALSFPPSDAVVAPDGLNVFAAGGAGVAIVNLSPARPFFREPVVLPLAGAKRLALTPDGRRLLVTRPDSSDVVEVDADASSATFGQRIRSIAVAGTPDGIAIGPNGRRAYVADAVSDRVYELDVDPSSATRGSLLRQRVARGAVFTGGLAPDLQANRLLATTRSHGLISIDLASDSGFVVLNPSPTAGAVAITPNGGEALACPDGSTGSPPLVSVRLPAVSSPVPLGGFPRSLALDPLGKTAWVVNSVFGRLQVIDIGDSSSQTYHSAVAEVATGLSPVAVSRSGDGTLLSVANFGSSSLSLYRTGGDVALVRVVPAVALPGDRVTIEVAGGAVIPQTRADVGSGDFPILDSSDPDPGAAAIVVPPSPQRDTRISLAVPPETRTQALPFRIVDPIQSFAPSLTGLEVEIDSTVCPENLSLGPIEFLRASPDGRILASLIGPTAASCQARLELNRITPDELGVIGGLLASTQTPFIAVYEAAFTSDGKRLWVVGDPELGPEITIYDTDLGSASFGQQVGSSGLTLGFGNIGLAADPGGRYMYVGAPDADAVIRVLPNGGPKDTLSFPPGTQVSPIAVTGDGRHVLVGHGDRASLIRSRESGMSVVATTPSHPGSIDRIVISSSGGFGFGHFSDGGVAVWNVNAVAVNPGAELSYGQPLPAGLVLGDWIPAPDGRSAISGCANCDSLVKLDPAVLPPIVTFRAVGHRTTRLQRSLDGRLLWTGPTSGLRGTVAYNLSETSRIASLTGPQEAAAGTPLPLPVRVQVTNQQGRPQAGTMVRFALSDVGQGSLGGPGVLQVHRATDARGEAEVTWTMPASVGSVALDIRALGTAASLGVVAKSFGADSLAAPAVVALGPADGAVGISSGTELFARFSQRMDSTSVAERLTVTANGNAVLGSIRLENRGRDVFFRPRASLPFGSACVLIVAAGALDREGQALADSATSRFTVQPQPSLAVNALSPPAGAVGAQVVIEGRSFSTAPAQNTVLFSGVLAPVVSATAAALAVKVPQGALSGPVTVQVGAAASNALPFSVLPRDTMPGVVSETIEASAGVRDLVVVPGSLRAYVTNPPGNSVTGFAVRPTQTLAIVPVGLSPQSIAILPDASRAYVANSGSGNVSVIDIDPSSADYHKVVGTIAVGKKPVDVAISPNGPTVLVVNAGDSTLSIIDARKDNATFDQVTGSVRLGSGGSQIVVVPDGTRAYVAVATGIVVIDVSSRQVTGSIRLGSGGAQVVVVPDGTLLFALTGDGALAVIDITPGSPTFNQVTGSVRLGSGGAQIVVTPDGTLLYASFQDQNKVTVFQIQKSNSSQSSSGVPGAAVTLAPVADIPVGQAPAAVAFDPSGGFGLVANEGSGTVTLIATRRQPLRARVLDPNGGEVLLSGSTYTLRWSAGDGAGVTSVDLFLSRDHGATYRPIATGLPNTGSYVWTVTGPTSGGMDPVFSALLKVTARDAAGDSVVDVSDAPFAIYDLATPTLLTRFELEPADVGVEVRWQLSGSGLLAEVRLERAEIETGPWIPVLAERTEREGVTVVLDRDAVPGRTHYYRLVASLGGGVVVFGPQKVALEARVLEFALEPIAPNPSRGGARIDFAVASESRVRLAVLDVAGREVARLAEGTYRPGRYHAVWGGAERGRAPAGLYFVRYQAGGRSFVRRLVVIP